MLLSVGLMFCVLVLCVFSADLLGCSGVELEFICCNQRTPESMEKKTDINPKDNHLSFQVYLHLVSLH